MVEQIRDMLTPQVEKIEADLKILETEIERAKRIGLDTRELETRYKTQADQLRLIKEVYKL